MRPARSDTSGVLPSKQKEPMNMSKVMLEKYIAWYEQVNKESSLTLDTRGGQAQTNMSSVSHSRISI